MGSHSVTCHPAEVTFPPLPQPKLVLDLATPEVQGWVDPGGWLEMVYPHNGHSLWTNRARCWLTSLMRPTTLTTTPSRHLSISIGTATNSIGSTSWVLMQVSANKFCFCSDPVEHAAADCMTHHWHWLGFEHTCKTMLFYRAYSTLPQCLCDCLRCKDCCTNPKSCAYSPTYLVDMSGNGFDIHIPSHSHSHVCRLFRFP